ncbi:putative bifunctional diguanylate cyclase/phosphodiesterase [Xanthobacter aminoxidans]|uniref:putative bifunctional diguanylate cyclase/phosphodiesterase n=1 Tax=Xanthobacter aminoxidans TaxID=186280 RepID=UPI0020230629|nr:EAL domain-containing protein [Xanthobacter aminoxidans]MCL8381791.1 EAL domain-containing protein [Xanthobacter aminoxidans]
MSGIFDWLEKGMPAVLDAIPVPVFVKDPDSRFILINRRCEEQWGIPRTEVVGGTGEGIFPPEQVMRLMENDRRALEGSAVACDEVMRNVALGQDRTLHTLRRAIRDQVGRTCSLVGVSVDITDIRRTEPALRDSEEKLRGLFELSPLGIVLNGMDGSYLEFNSAFCAICGYSPDELRRLDYWTLTPTKYAAQEREQLDALLTQGHYGPYEKEYIRKDGSLVPLRLTGVRLHASDGGSYIWSIVEDISAQKKAQEAVWYHANFDDITALPNRRLVHQRLEEEIARARGTGRRMALLFIDFDRFKEINDAFGHDKGDMLLKEAARRLAERLSAGDTVGRLNGDEFMIVAAEDDIRRLRELADDLRQALGAPYRLGADLAYSSVSIGIAVFPQDGENAEALVRHADQAMYEAKGLGRNRCRFFRSALQEEATRRGRIANELRGAIAGGQFRLFYQPIIDLGTGEVLKAEALLRWQHPQMGLVSPAEFIPVAEQTGEIIAIGQWVFEDVLRQITAWDAAGLPPIRIGVNRSPVEFRQSADVLDAWAERLAEHGLSGRRILVEITEGLLVELSDTVRDQFERLQGMGISLSLDDFGTGYSSLAYLRKFDVDFLKIDRAFVQGVERGSDDLALCEAIIVMAQKLGIEVVAEGIETEDQCALLVTAGCRLGQGFLFSRPLPADAFAAYLRGAAQHG